MRYKRGVSKLRTAEVARSFNRLLEVLLEARCDGLYGCSSEVRAALPRVKRKQSDGKKLLKKNILQRRLVEREMNRFQFDLYEGEGNPAQSSHDHVPSRFVTDRVTGYGSSAINETATGSGPQM
ncbi:hypothetical protein V3C99_004209 [Haemonchus contortus]